MHYDSATADIRSCLGMAVGLLPAPGCLGSQVLGVARSGCCRAQRIVSFGCLGQGGRRLREDAAAADEAGSRAAGCVGCITAAGIDSCSFEVASVAAFAAGDNCSQSSSPLGLRECPDVFRSSSCRT